MWFIATYLNSIGNLSKNIKSDNIFSSEWLEILYHNTTDLHYILHTILPNNIYNPRALVDNIENQVYIDIPCLKFAVSRYCEMLVDEEITSVVGKSTNSNVTFSVVDDPSISYVSKFVEFIGKCAIVKETGSVVLSVQMIINFLSSAFV